MVAATSKMVFGLITTIATFIAVLIGGWKLAEHNERHQDLRQQNFIGVENSNPDFVYVNNSSSSNPQELSQRPTEEMLQSSNI